MCPEGDPISSRSDREVTGHSCPCSLLPDWSVRIHVLSPVWLFLRSRWHPCFLPSGFQDFTASLAINGQRPEGFLLRGRSLAGQSRCATPLVHPWITRVVCFSVGVFPRHVTDYVRTYILRIYIYLYIGSL